MVLFCVKYPLYLQVMFIKYPLYLQVLWGGGKVPQAPCAGHARALGGRGPTCDGPDLGLATTGKMVHAVKWGKMYIYIYIYILFT